MKNGVVLTPPMGWNSWNCWGLAVDDGKTRAAAKAMVDSGLSKHGWTYINIDDGWQGERGGHYNALQGNEKFPDVKGLCDYVHSLGLKIGIYSTPWARSYGGYPGSKGYEFEDAKQWAEWGIDYLKYDWFPIDSDNVRRMHNALEAAGRGIVYSLSNSASMAQGQEWAKLSNLWRTTGDITDTWESIEELGFNQDRLERFAGPGHWNDPDMLVIGMLGAGGDASSWPRGEKLHPTRLSKDEQRTHISLWCILAAPLLLGCDLTHLDEWTLSLITNPEVLTVNQDEAGIQGHCVRRANGLEVWVKELSGGSADVGLFNRNDKTAALKLCWEDICPGGDYVIRDLWKQSDIGQAKDTYLTELSPHGCALLSLSR